jgi:hypothetical protein
MTPTPKKISSWPLLDPLVEALAFAGLTEEAPADELADVFGIGAPTASAASLVKGCAGPRPAGLDD